MKNKIIFLICVIVITISCKRDNFNEKFPKNPVPIFNPNGFWVVNEGTFGFGNGDVSFIDPLKNEISNGIFASANGIPVGDIPFDIFVDHNAILLSVNNSGKLWVLQKDSFKIKFNIAPMISPRHIEKISNNNYAVSSFANDSLYFVDLSSENPVVTSMFTGKSTESLLMAGNKLYVTNWSSWGGNYDNSTVQIIDPFARIVLGQIQVGKEPNSMAIDKNGKLWVLCSGGYLNEEIPRLFRISLLTHQVEKEFLFPSQNMSPFSLSIDRAGQELNFINVHIYRMNIDDAELPVSPLIQADTENFYALGAGIYTDTIIATDAGDYMTPGKVYLFDKSGNTLKSFDVGIIPGTVVENK
jgi:hypothetical protein